MTDWSKWPDELAEHCPDCGSPPGKLCVYLPVVGVDPEFLHYRSAKVQARMALVGQPTKRPHNGRFNKATERARRRRIMQVRREAKAAVAPVSTDTIAAARTLHEFNRQENERLRGWLAQHGRILFNTAPTSH
jgi:hypothetical protein